MVDSNKKVTLHQENDSDGSLEDELADEFIDTLPNIRADGSMKAFADGDRRLTAMKKIVAARL